MLFGLPKNEKSVKLDYGDKKITLKGKGRKKKLRGKITCLNKTTC